jgi:hypothetical protein
MFCAPRLVFGGTKSVRSRFHVLRPRNRFRWCRVRQVPFSCFVRRVPFSYFRRYRGRRVPFSCFARPDSFSVVPRVSGPVFMFCAPGLVLGDTEGVGSRFHVLRSKARFWRCQERQVPFSCFAHPNSFSVVPRVLGPVFMFCAPGLVIGSTEGVGSRFHVLCS